MTKETDFQEIYGNIQNGAQDFESLDSVSIAIHNTTVF